MKITLRVSFVDGTSKDVVCSASDLVAFEDRFNISVTRLEAEMKITHLLFLAWHSENRTKATGLDFDAWIDSVETIGPGSNPK